MRFCADSIRSCFFIEKSGTSRGCPCLLEKAMNLPIGGLWFFSVLDGNSYHLLQLIVLEKTPTTHVRIIVKGAARLGSKNTKTTNPAQTLLLVCHLL